MRRKKMDDVLPTLGQSQQQIISEEKPDLENLPVRSISVTLSIPMLTQVEGFATRHVETKLTHDESIAFKAVLLALVAKGTKLKSGRSVKRPADVYRWLAEQIAINYAYNDRHRN